MTNCDIDSIISGNEVEASKSLERFVQNHTQTFSFPELEKGDLRENVWLAIFHYLQSQSALSFHKNCLAAIRILSRDKAKLNELMREKWIDILIHFAGLQTETILSVKNYEQMVEANKCLCNILFNSTVAQAICAKNELVDGIINRLKLYREPELPHDLKFYDMRLLFLATALCPEVRPKLIQELHGLTYLTETLDLMLKQATGESEASNGACCVMDDHVSLSDEQVDLASEILKILFNLTLRPSDLQIDEEDEAHFLRLVTVLHDLLLARTQSQKKRPELHSHIINLLTGVPISCYKQLVNLEQKGQSLPKEFEFEGHNMEIIFVFLEFLKDRFNNPNPALGQQEAISPILTVLLKCATGSRIMRKYLRLQILPPLKDVHHRPEEGTTLRNHLCKLLTVPVTQLKHLAAELLFLLCKQNVARMIKYTGYGNAAGLFATKGLMAGGNPSESAFSSDSENSDTEEYLEHKHGINPVIGCYEPPHPNPTAGMTEEQKEYEALKLVNLIDDLSRKGVMQPCKIGEDGRPEPIGHILELQKELPKQQLNRNSDDSD